MIHNRLRAFGGWGEEEREAEMRVAEVAQSIQEFWAAVRRCGGWGTWRKEEEGVKIRRRRWWTLSATVRRRQEEGLIDK